MNHFKNTEVKVGAMKR